MDQIVLRAQARWPDVPDVFGWLALNRRGQWLLRNPVLDSFEPIGNVALREFIARNYSSDSRGRWFFQNGPQRVFVRLAYTPLVARISGAGFIDQCGRKLENRAEMLDEEGSLLLVASNTVALLDDRDLAAFADARGDSIEAIPRMESKAIPQRFGFVQDPQP